MISQMVVIKPHWETLLSHYKLLVLDSDTKVKTTVEKMTFSDID